MPQTKSAKRALRKDLRRRAVNAVVRKKTKQAVKAARQKTDANKVAQAYSLLDRASKKGIIHKNKAARLKSRLAKHQPQKETSKTSAKTRSKKSLL